MFYIFNIFLSFTSSATAATSTLIVDPMNYYQYTQLQAPLSWESISSRGLEQALHSCQQSFQWQRWNCPSNDFFLRHATRNSKATTLDREDAYVAAISMAAVLYTLTKDCGNGLIAGCGCSDNALNVPCAHKPAKALQMYEQRFGGEQQAASKVAAHNQRVVGKLLEQSLEQECRCKQLDATQTHCLEEECVYVLKPFESIAQELQQMYNDAVQLDATDSNLTIMWQNIPLDTLVYMQDSPNYCEAEASGRWPGTLGRQCSKSGSHGSADERLSCTQICRVCGYRVRMQHVRNERRCNCKLVWGFRLQCDVCVQLERQYYCH